MSKEGQKVKAAFGCGFMLAHALVRFPLWAYVVYLILERTDATDFQYGMFWAWAVITLLLTIGQGTMSFVIETADATE